MKKERLHEFKGTQDDLYAVSARAWALYNKHQPDFANFNGVYTKDLGAQNLAAIEAARALPGVSVRRATPKELRETLGPKADVCLTLSLTLFSGIEKVFPITEWETEKQKAGAADYAAAGKYKWRKVTAFTDAGSAYLAANWDQLQNGGKGLPDNFQARYTEAKTTFDNGYAVYGGSRSDFTDQTTAKADANNAIYRSTISMLDDGKIIYRKAIRTKMQFAYANILASVTSGGKTGFLFQLSAEGSEALMSTATIFLTPGSKQATTEADGEAIIETGAGTYNYTVTAPGFQPAEGTAIASASILRRVKVLLKKAAEQVLTA